MKFHSIADGVVLHLKAKTHTKVDTRRFRERERENKDQPEVYE